MSEKIYESGEDYLETILILKNKNGNVRAIDIANYLGFSKPSVSRATSVLKSKGFIVVDNGHIELTESGRKIAEKTYEKHVTFTNFLIKIGVNEKTAAHDACRIEHAISEESFKCLKEFISQLEK